MDYALVLRALGRHVGITERSVQFFREKRMGRQFDDAVTLLEEAIRARDEVIKMRELYQLQVSLHKANMGPPPTPFPDEKPLHSGPPSTDKDFPDEPLVDAEIRPAPPSSPLKPI